MELLTGEDCNNISDGEAERDFFLSNEDVQLNIES
jgi:hypothetical protein